MGGFLVFCLFGSTVLWSAVILCLRCSSLSRVAPSARLSYWVRAFSLLFCVSGLLLAMLHPAAPTLPPTRLFSWRPLLGGQGIFLHSPSPCVLFLFHGSANLIYAALAALCSCLLPFARMPHNWAFFCHAYARRAFCSGPKPAFHMALSCLRPLSVGRFCISRTSSPLLLHRLLDADIIAARAFSTFHRTHLTLQSGVRAEFSPGAFENTT